jgi:hypothetical protein
MKKCSVAEMERGNQEFVDELGILSMSSKCDNILMWSHYANSHRGFCLEFDSSKKPFSSANHVEYLSNPRPFDPYGSHEANARSFVLTKYDNWAYEDEWRVIVPRCRENYSFEPEALTGVILGFAISESDRNRVNAWIDRGHCHPVRYRAKRKEGDFGLIIERE